MMKEISVPVNEISIGRVDIVVPEDATADDIYEETMKAIENGMLVANATEYAFPTTERKKFKFERTITGTVEIEVGPTISNDEIIERINDEVAKMGTGESTVYITMAGTQYEEM